jgi:hypothetical protein
MYFSKNKKYLFDALAHSGMRVVQFTAILLIILISYSFQGRPRNYQIECVSLESEGYITIKIWTPQKGSNYKVHEAKMDAIHAILFSGVTGGPKCPPLIPILDTPQEKEKFKAIENEFFAKKGEWQNFANHTITETTVPDRLVNKKWNGYQISIAKTNLNQYLINHNIIKSLSDGF